MEIKKINHKCILPSAAITLKGKKIKFYTTIDKKPEVGDLIYGEVAYLGQQTHAESVAGRIHTIHDSKKGVFILGNRYAPDYYEGVVPDTFSTELDLLSRSGVVGKVLHKNALISDPTRIRLLGYICNSNGEILNTMQNPLVIPKKKQITHNKRARLILCIGTSMNSGKSHAAATCCYTLSSMNKNVRAAKITGTAGLKDILLMEDCGASYAVDFSYLGYPSTYRLDAQELLNIFNTIDLKYGNNHANYLVIEIADGILQRETAMLLQMPELRTRIHKIVFCAQDAFGVIGGVRTLKEKFDLVPAAISGICSSSPLAIRELQEYIDIPVFNSVERKVQKIFDIIK